MQVRYDAAGRQQSAIDQLGHDASSVYDELSRVIETISALNHSVSSVHDLAGRVTQTTETTLNADGTPAGTATVLRDYDVAGRVSTVTDALGRVTYYEYDGLGRVVSVTDARGNSISNTYLNTGQTLTTTNQVGVITRYAYDVTGRLLSTTVDDGGLALTTRFSYDELDRLTQVTDPRGATIGDPNYTTTYAYDARGNMIARTDSNGTTTFAYDAADRLISRTDPVGNVIYYLHDANGNILGVTSPGTTNFVNVALAAGVVATGGTLPGYAIDGITTDLAKYTTTNWAVSPQEKLELTLPALYAIERIRVRLYDGDTRFFDYKVDVSADGIKYDRVVDKTAGEWRSWQDDAFAARPVKYIRITGTYSSASWAFHTLEVEAYVDTAKTSYVYDAENRLTHQTDALGRYITHAYDAKGHRVSTVYPAGSALPMDGTTVTYQYDAGDRLVSRTQTGTVAVPQSTYEYDSGGNLTERADAAGTYSYEYDAADRLTSMRDANGVEVAAYTYDENGNCLTKTVTFGGVATLTTYTYDACNRMITQVATRSGVTVQNLAYTYRTTGQLETLTDAVAGSVTTYGYDAAGQVVSERVQTGVSVIERTYTYDGSGNRTSVTESSPTVQQNDAKLVYYGTWSTGSSSLFSGGSHTYSSAIGASMSVAFDGDRAQVVATKSYNYGLMRVYVDGVQVADVDLYSPTTAYQQVVFDTGVLTDGWHTIRLDRTGTKNASSTGTTVSLDAILLVGAVATYATRREQNDASVSRVGTWSTTSSSSYSGSSFSYTTTAGSYATTTYTGEGFVLLARTGTAYGKARIYIDGIETDLVSLYSSTTLYKQAVLRKTLPYGTHTIRVEWTGLKDAAATATTINIDAFDLLAAPSVPATPAPSQTLTFDAGNRVVGYTYDARGNVLTDGTYTFTWDAYNRLTQVKLTSTGAVVASYTYDANGMRQVATIGTTTTRFAVDALTDEIVALIDTTGAVVTRFVRDAAGALVAMVTGGATFTYLTNAHGDVTALVDSAGAIVARWTYDAWGVPTEHNASGGQVALGTAGNPFLNAGYYYDTQTGRYYLRARYYDPRTGRFLSMDPEPGKTTDRLSQNPYIYCQNDPVNFTDPTGRRAEAGGGGGMLTQSQLYKLEQIRLERRKAEERRRREAKAREEAKKRAAAQKAKSKSRAGSNPLDYVGVGVRWNLRGKPIQKELKPLKALGRWLFGSISAVGEDLETEVASKKPNPAVVLRGDLTTSFSDTGLASPDGGVSVKMGKTTLSVTPGSEGVLKKSVTVELSGEEGETTRLTYAKDGLDSYVGRFTTGTTVVHKPELRDGWYHTTSSYVGAGTEVEIHPMRTIEAVKVVVVGVVVVRVVLGAAASVLVGLGAQKAMEGAFSM